ncbi:hypothetical protein [Flavobacterium cerinum]|uniref:Uncharacterized protein n=1 Tax=Flavobacterium cerinum TaxID=2502784 RepID=A0A444GMT9_9FLAO|nr:hypothetical protein [Flavobacterium cerinum]RWW92340.1 hypothetical protein EPI11_15630 [Flavobacterium cerinum]
MKNINGEELYDLIQNGTVVLSDDKKTLINTTTKEVLGRQVTSKDGSVCYRAIGDNNDDTRGGEVCLKVKWDEKLQVEICVKWG